jgi:LCP family protein required for cell wall assembly
VAAPVKGWLHRHGRALAIGCLAVIIVLGSGFGYYFWLLNSKIDDIPRIPIDSIKDRPDQDSGRDLNILLLGSDKGKEGPEFGEGVLAEDARADVWPAGKYRSDTLMVVHISGSRKQVSLVSIPRDTLTTIHDATGTAHDRAKINEAFSAYGPAGAVATVEHLTNLRMDHLAVIDWAGFKELSTAVGGVPVTIPEAFCDEKQHKCWEARDYLLEGDEALQYVRTRDGLLRSDFARIERQQNFLRSLMTELLESGDVFKPLEFTDMLSALTTNLVVDAGWDNGEIRSLALGLRGTKADEVVFVTAPVAETPTLAGYGSVVLLDEEGTTELFDALRDDKVKAWVSDHPEAVLPDPDEIE